MATYKQRTPYQRHTVIYSDDEDAHAVQTSHQHPSHYHHGHNSHYYQVEDGILDNTSDREWTSIRNSASARAKARQQQYLDQQQQRTREWQFVLSQHRQNSYSITTTTSRGISSDEYDEVFSAAEPPSIIASPHIADPTTENTQTTTGEHSSVLGFSDLTSDGLESLGESEDLGVWSHEDDDELMSMPTLRRSSTSSSSSPLAASTTSLSRIPRPSFADGPRNVSSSHIESKFQNQMPFHDGSGNFVERVPSTRESDVESERGWESSSSRTSSGFHSYHRPKETPIHRPIVSPEFKTVIQNIADLQRTNTGAPLVRSSSRHKTLEGFAPTTSSARPTFTYPHVISKRPIFNIYESEMEDLSEMVELPVKMSWLQAFEQTLRAMKPQEYNINTDDNSMSPIKAWAKQLSHDDELMTAESSKSPTIAEVEHQQSGTSPSETEPESSAETQARLDQVQKNMSAASLAALKRLQTRKRANPHHRDPMQIDFTPTITEDLSPMDSASYRRNRRVLSRSTGTSTSTAHETNLLAVVLSTLRHFRDHVQSNFMFSEFYDNDERSNYLSRTLGPDGDLGIEWSTGDVSATGERIGGTASGTMEVAAVAAAVGSSTSRTTTERRYRRASSVASSARSSIRRVNSDCGLESMRSYRSHDSNHPIHSSYHSSLVE
ncbi:hypothetical protein FBU30_000087 [Linnemannia zychae]|nr:hypothetical protein FBU30_000087 [Linnemannia zychae]